MTEQKKRWYMAYDPMESLAIWMEETGESDITKAFIAWNAAPEPLVWRMIHGLRGLWYTIVAAFTGRPF